MKNIHKFGVIFDMDGVIVHSNPTHKIAIQIFCKRHNQDVSQSFLENRLYGRTNKEWIPELFEDSLSEDKLAALADEKEQLFRDMFDPYENRVTGIENFLQLLKNNNIPMVVATSAPRENADYILSELDIRDFFDAVLDSSHVNKGKPEPEVYLKASSALGFKAEQCIVFEDSIAGVQAGLNAGSKVVGVTTTHSKEELVHCHHIIEDFTGIQLENLTRLFD